MNERIHRALDGELPLEELTAEERRELDGYRTVIRETAALHRGETAPDLAGSVMGRIASREPAGLEAAPSSSGSREAAARLLSWMWEPRPVRLRPAYGLAAAAAFLVVLLALPTEPPSVDGVTAAPEPPTQVFVQFRLDAPDASTVRLAGTFTQWQPEHLMRESAPGVWTILIPLAPGVHEYAFVVDEGEWRADLHAPRVSDGFGGENSRLAVLVPDDRSS